MALRQFRHHHHSDSIRRASRLDSRLSHLLLSRRRRNQHLDGSADRDHLFHLGVRELQHRSRRARLLRAAAAARHRHDGRVRGARFFPVLHLLGSDAAADVLPDRHLGRSAARVRRDQVLSLHAARLGADPAGDAGAVLLRRDADLRHDRARRQRRSLLDDLSARRVDRAVYRLRDQNPGLSVSYLAARRARRGAHRDQRHPGRRAAQDGHLRHPAHQLFRFCRRPATSSPSGCSA